MKVAEEERQQKTLHRTKRVLKKTPKELAKNPLSCFLFTAMASKYLIFQTHEELFAYSFINIYYWQYFTLLKKESH